ncbi:MAG: glycosyltransferase [Desulfomonilaceae bacterium]
MGRIPPVAIGLPVYNGEKYLAESIESVLAQDFGDFDFLISDNCSTDSTWEICNYYSLKDRRIRLNRNEKNLGAIGNFEFVLNNTDSKYFMWHSHDDLLDPSYVAECFSFLEQHDEYNICFSKVALIDENGRPYICELANETRDEDSPILRFKHHCESGFPVYFIYGLIRRKVWRQIEPIPRMVKGVDRLLGAELAIYGKMYQINQTLRYFRTSTAPDAIMRNLITWGPQGLLAARNPIAFLPVTRWRLVLISRINRATQLDHDIKSQLIKIAKNHLSFQTLVIGEIGYYKNVAKAYLLIYFPWLFNALRKLKKTSRIFLLSHGK